MLGTNFICKTLCVLWSKISQLASRMQGREAKLVAGKGKLQASVLLGLNEKGTAATYIRKLTSVV